MGIFTAFLFERKASEKKQKALSANSFIPFYSEFKFIMFSQILTLQSANKSIAFFIPQIFFNVAKFKFCEFEGVARRANFALPACSDFGFGDFQLPERFSLKQKSLGTTLKKDYSKV